MGLFEVSSWGGEDTKKKDKRKKRREIQKRKNVEDKQKSKIVTIKKSKINKKKKKYSVMNASLNETQKEESSKQKPKVQKNKLKKLQQNSLTTLSKIKKLKKKFIPKNKFKAISEGETNLKMPIVVTKSKKRKRESDEEKVEKTPKIKKQKKLKQITNLTKNWIKSKSPDKQQLTDSVSEKDRNKNLNKIKGMLQDKKKEKKNEPKVTSLRERMLAQLRSSRFRFLNETLYSNESSQSKRLFKDDPEAFTAYHEGYKQQVNHWPLNPLDTIIESIKKMPKDYIIADFGCGEAKLAESVPQKVHSFDFIAINDNVKACDMAHTPLLTNGVNVAVFCLSLMGTNLTDYLLEANRVLKKGGIMKIAEVESRFDNIENFINLVSAYGFVNTWNDCTNDLFYFLDFKKEKDIDKGKKSKLPAIELKPCLYKKR